MNKQGAKSAGCTSLKSLIEDLFDDLAKRITDQRRAVLRSLDEDISTQAVSNSLNREAKLTLALREAIDVLEETKQAFKSKKLARLRSRLEDVLNGLDK